MRKTLTTVALLLALSCTAFGGEMSAPPAPTPPQPASAVQEPTDDTTLNGEMGTPGIMHTTGVSDALTQAALDLLALLPSLL